MSLLDSQSLTTQYEELGYLTCLNVLSAEELERLRHRIDEIATGTTSFPIGDIEQEPLPPGVEETANHGLRKLNRCAENDSVFLAHAKHPHVLDIVESLIGPDIKLYDSQCFLKPPGGIEKPYHQDSAYFSIEPMQLVTCWTAIDDVTMDNGCLKVIPGSHRHGVVEHSQPWDVGGRVDMQVPDDAIAWDSEVALTMPAGSCSFHHSVLLHRSGANSSDRSRRGLAVHYMSARSVWTHPTRPQPKFLLLRGREHPGCV